MKDAEKIMALMEARHLSQNKFAKEVGVSQSQISYIINGKMILTEALKNKICLALDIDKSYFIETLQETQEESKEPQEIKTPTNNAGTNVITQDDLDNFGDIISLVITIQEARDQLLQLIKIEREKVKQYSGNDQNFLHDIESLEDLTDQQAIDMLLKEKASRKGRRKVKNRIFILQNLLNQIVSNPYQFTLNGIDMTKNFKYTRRIEAEVSKVENENNYN